MGGEKKTWEVKCEDGSGRERVFLVKAERDSGRVVLIAPAGEAGVLHNLGVYELSEAIRSAWVFASSKSTKDSDSTSTLAIAPPEGASTIAETPGQRGGPASAWPTGCLLIS